MAISRGSFFAGDPLYLSDEQIEAATIKWLEFLKSTTYTHDSAAVNSRCRVHFATENKQFLLDKLECEHPTWEQEFTQAFTAFLTQHRRQKHLTLHYEYAAEDLLETFIEGIPFLRGKTGLFPINTTMTFASDEDTIFINGTELSATDIIDPPAAAHDICNKLGCPRFKPALQRLLGR